MAYRPPPRFDARPDRPLTPYLRAIRAHPLLIAACVFIAVSAGIAIAEKRKRNYEATAQILVTPLSEGANNGAYTGLPIVTTSAAEPTRTLETAATILKTRQAATLAAKELPGWTGERINNAISVEPRGESNIVAVTATEKNPYVAARLANAYLTAALTTRSGELKTIASGLITELQEREKAVSSTNVTTLAELAGQVTALVPIANGHDPNFAPLQQAAVPGAPTGTSTTLIVMLAALAGLVIGIAAAVGVEYLNRRIRDEDEALSVYPLPVLARVPQMPREIQRASSFELMAPRVREAFRSLQVQLPPSLPGRGRSVMITSASMGDGKTSCAISFALVLAAAGNTVILIDFDLRKPDVGERVGGHTDVMQLLRADGGLRSALIESPDSPRLSVVSASHSGDVTPMLEAVSRRLPDLLNEAVELADYVIVDTTPLGAVSDALRLATMVDDILLVVRVSSTDRVELERTRDLLERMGHTPTGMVVVGEATRGHSYGTYANDRGPAVAVDDESRLGVVGGPPDDLESPRQTVREGPGSRSAEPQKRRVAAHRLQRGLGS